MVSKTMELDVQTIIQGGAVGIAISLIGLFAYFIKVVSKIASNHLSHLTEAINRLAEKIERAIERR